MKRGKLKKPSSASVSQEPAKPEVVQPVAPFSFRVTEREYTRLREGDVIIHDGVEQVVIQLTPCCARIIPINSTGVKSVSFTPRFADKPVVFNAPVKVATTSISANSECPVLRRLGPNWKDKITTPPTDTPARLNKPCGN